MACSLCNGSGMLWAGVFSDYCPLCEGVHGWPEREPHVFPSGTKLPGKDQGAVSVLTYNVLLPNGSDGWWIHKYYGTDGAHTAWPARKALLKDQISSISADVVCLQECCDCSFTTDFDFMVELGYERLKHKKNHVQGSPASFWKTDRLELVKDLHENKTLVTALKLKDAPQTTFWVINCHLPGKPDDALRAVADGALKAVAKELAKLKSLQGPCILCGDLNSQGNSAIDEVLRKGEAADPITGKVKKQTAGNFMHAQRAVFGREVPTMLCPDLFPKMVRQDGSMTPELEAALDAAFESLAEGKAIMDKDAVEKYLLAICQGISNPLARISSDLDAELEGPRQPWCVELQGVKNIFAASGREQLTRDDFLSPYVRAIKQGKPWIVEYDLRALGGTGVAVPSEGPCELCFDHMYFTSEMRLIGVQAALTEDHRKAVYGPPWDILPNEWHPSDHLPLAAVFAFK